jgi:ABC-2 type transport system permease protein
VIGALAFLISTSTRNRFRSQIRRIRNPRYALALVVGVAYFWFFLIRPSARGPRGAGGPGILLGPSSEAIMPLLVLLFVSGTWLFGSDRSALAFSQAEVSMLFTAPISRRGLIAYKLVRAQLAVLINSLIFVFLLQRGNPRIPGVLAVMGMWVMLTTLNFHRLGAALVHASSTEYRSKGARRNWMSIVLFTGIMAVVFIQMFGARAELAGGADPFAFLATVVAVLSTPAARIALLPFRVVLAPTYAQDVTDWARAMVPALGMLALHAVWLMRTNTAFEEAAADASEERAKRIEALRARRATAPVTSAAGGVRTMPLDSWGHPAVAIVWKNVLCLMRTSQLRLLLMPVTLGVVVAFAMPGGEGDAAQRIALMATVMAGFLLLLGSRSFRSDLRSDMTHLPLLKSLPLRGTDLVLAEVASGALPLAAAQFVLLLVAELALNSSVRHSVRVPADVALGALVAAPVLLLAVNGAMFTIFNGTAVLFPAWVRLGPAAATGIEAMGQNLLATVGSMVVLGVLLILPAAAGGAVFFLWRVHAGLAFALAGNAGGAVLLLETYGILARLGRAFDRAEPTLVG